jgi:hypothetical protein
MAHRIVTCELGRRWLRPGAWKNHLLGRDNNDLLLGDLPKLVREVVVLDSRILLAQHAKAAIRPEQKGRLPEEEGGGGGQLEQQFDCSHPGRDSLRHTHN